VNIRNRLVCLISVTHMFESHYSQLSLASYIVSWVELRLKVTEPNIQNSINWDQFLYITVLIIWQSWATFTENANIWHTSGANCCHWLPYWNVRVVSIVLNIEILDMAGKPITTSFCNH